MDSIKIVPPTWLLNAITVVLGLHFLFSAAWIIPPVWNLLGFILLTLAAVRNQLGDKAFIQVNTTIKPFQKSSVLWSKIVCWLRSLGLSGKHTGRPQDSDGNYQAMAIFGTLHICKN